MALLSMGAIGEQAFVEEENPLSGGSSNSGFWFTKVKNASSFNAD
jgi:hypothetical protein